MRDPLADHLIILQNAALLLIDYRPSPLAAVHSMDHALLGATCVTAGTYVAHDRQPVRIRG